MKHLGIFKAFGAAAALAAVSGCGDTAMERAQLQVATDRAYAEKNGCTLQYKQVSAYRSDSAGNESYSDISVPLFTGCKTDPERRGLNGIGKFAQ